MPHAILLLTNDAALADKVRRALPPNIPALLTVAASCAAAAAPPRGWLLVLCDGLCPAAVAPGGAEALPGAGSAPLLWLGEAPSSAAIASIAPAWRERIVDYLDRRLPASKLAFILHQHLSAAYLRHARTLAAASAAWSQAMGEAAIASRSRRHDARQYQLNNTLTGIMGNAALASELAADAGRRLAAPLTLRLQRINELTVQLRDLLVAPPEPEPSAIIMPE
ncbi:MAG TPA: hypothetical protein VIC32_02635 [Terriglobales bacterium]